MNSRDYAITAKQLQGDVYLMLESDPDAFDATLYRAISGTNEEQSHDMPDVVGVLEGAEKRLEYDDPLDTRAFILPPELAGMSAIDAGDGIIENSAEQPRVFLIQEADIPKHSVLEFDEIDADGKMRRVAYYIIRSEPMSEAPAAGFRHFGIPFMAGDDLIRR